MKTLLCLLLMASSCLVYSQRSVKFKSQIYVGLLEGNERSRFQIQTINGIGIKQWFLGAGTGLDHYYFRSVPLFLSLNRYLCDCNRSWFISADAGVNWVWDKSTGNWINGYRDGGFKPGLYWASRLGYRVGLKNNKDAILLNAGFSAKHVRQEVKSVYPCVVPPCPETVEKISYKFNRLSLRVGWEF